MSTTIKNKHLLILFVSLSSTISSFSQDKVVLENKLPLEIKQYIKIYFPNTPIIQVIEDNEVYSKTYEVLLQNNIKLDFNRQNKIHSIDGISKLPDSVIPATVLSYVKRNYPNNVITDWELDDGNQQIELDNFLNLEFTMQGQFLRIDY